MIRQLKRIRESLGTECTSTQVLALLTIAEYGKGDWLTVSALGDLCKVSEHAASRAIKFLVELDLVGWEKSPDDERKRIVFLSESGEVLMESLYV